MTVMIKGVIGIDPGIRRLLTWMMVDHLGKPIQVWHREGGPGMLTFIKYVAGDATIGRRQAEAAKIEMGAVLHGAAKEIVKRAATYHFGIAIEELSEDQETSGMTQVMAFEKAQVMAPAQAAFFLAPFQFFHHDLITLCRAAGVPEPVLIEPSYTSSTCPACWQVNRYNRSGGSFRCNNCKYEADADENAAHIIGVLAMAKQVKAGLWQLPAEREA